MNDKFFSFFFFNNINPNHINLFHFLIRTAAIVDLVNGPMKKDISVTKDANKILYLDLFTDQAIPKREIMR